MKKLLKKISLSGLVMFMAFIISGCGDNNKVNVNNFYFPILVNRTWEGDVVTYGGKTAYVELIFEENEKGYYTLTVSGEEPQTGKMTYLIYGTILQLRNIPEMLDQPWTLIKVEDRKMMFEGTPNKDHFKPTLSLARK